MLQFDQNALLLHNQYSTKIIKLIPIIDSYMPFSRSGHRRSMFIGHYCTCQSVKLQPDCMPHWSDAQCTENVGFVWCNLLYSTALYVRSCLLCTMCVSMHCEKVSSQYVAVTGWISVHSCTEQRCFLKLMNISLGENELPPGNTSCAHHCNAYWPVLLPLHWWSSCSHWCQQ